MPFSRKNKTRRNRFSQLLADHLPPPKHGGSLVVETGFPTSVIDPYVRNRGRLRKSTAKKQRQNDSYNSSLLSASFVDLNDRSSSGSSVDSCNSSSGYSDYKSEAENSVGMVELNPGVVVAFKVLFMVVLVIRSKRFTIGITLSAFLLFFLESMGKRLLKRSISITRSVDSKPLSEISVQKTKNIKSIKQNSSYSTLVVCNEVLESNQEVGSDDGFMEIRHKSSRRARMKSRIKKLVRKKLRKPSTDSNHAICCEFEEEETTKSSQNVKPLVLSNEGSDSKGETSCVLKHNQDMIVETGGRSLSSEIECNSGCLFLFLIVLVGLIGGRVFALVIVLCWCLMLKKLQGRNVKFPIS